MKGLENSKTNLKYLAPLLIYLGSLYSMPQLLFVLALIVKLALNNFKFYTKNRIDISIILIVIALSLCNYLYGLVYFINSDNRSPYFLAYIVTFALANLLDEKDIKFIVWLITIECVFVFIEVANGENTIFRSHPEYRGNFSFAMLYFARPFGLSDGVNSMGGKILLAIIFLDYLFKHSTTKNICRVILFAALVVVFSRTALIAAIVHYFIYFTFKYKASSKWMIAATVATFVGLAMYLLADSPLEIVLDQLNRGKEDGVDLSYRDVIWKSNIDFIANYPLMGNGSSKYYTWIADYGAWEHSHNSFLEMVASNGIIISFIVLIWFAAKHNSKNINLSIPIVIFSIGQYGVFWGVSFMDILFYYLIFKYARDNKNISEKI